MRLDGERLSARQWYPERPLCWCRSTGPSVRRKPWTPCRMQSKFRAGEWVKDDWIWCGHASRSRARNGNDMNHVEGSTPMPVWIAALLASQCQAMAGDRDHEIRWKCEGGRLRYTNTGLATEVIEPLGVKPKGGHTIAVSWVPGILRTPSKSSANSTAAPDRIPFVRVLPAAFAAALVFAQSERPRARELGLAPGVFPPGTLNAITDVSGVRVGHVTLIEGDQIRTGVTAVLPTGGNLFQEKVPGAVFVGNAFGKLAGSTQVEELGTIETPIVLTNTLNVGAAMEGVIQYTLGLPGNERVRSVNAVVGETNDGGLNDIRGMHVRREHVIEAIRAARGGAVAEGSVGAGTGTMCYGWKGGIGTSSRKAGPQYGG